MSTHIVSIHAHPDDAEILAGGTLALLASKGHRITIVTMTPGDCGSAEHNAEEIAAIRRQEAVDAAAIIGANYICAEFRDLAIFSDDASRRRVVELIRSVRPDIVLTSAPTDYHCDHEATSALDCETELAITGAIDRLCGEKTTIFIAHRLSTVRHCDQILLMKEGHIADRVPLRSFLSGARISSA